MPIVDDVPFISWLFTTFGYVFIVVFLLGSFYLTVKTAIQWYRKKRIALSAGLVSWYVIFPIVVFFTIYYRDELTDPIKIPLAIVLGVLLPAWIFTGYLAWAGNRKNNVSKEG